jgi:chloramphenicol 3-O phosphotransferase
VTNDEHGSNALTGRVGRIILLNGASSAGKSTLSRAIQVALEEPFLHCSSDILAVGLPARRDSHGPFVWWGNVRPRFFAGFHGCVAALALAGNDLIVEHIIEFPEWRTDLSKLLLPFDVFLVGVHCSLGEIERRERARGDRRIGEGREHVEVDRIHDFGPYDFEIDTTDRDPSEVAVEVLRHWRARATSVLRIGAGT